jgi:hypothetical protein
MSLVKKLLIAVGCVFSLGTCKKSGPTPGNYISFKVNGVYKNFKPDASPFTDGSFLLDAGPSIKGEIGLFLETSPQLTAYDLANDSIAIADYYDSSGIHFWSDSGTLVISAYNGKHISGTFAFRGRTHDKNTVATINVTEGQFSADIGPLLNLPDTCALRNPEFTAGKRSGVAERFLLHRLSPTYHSLQLDSMENKRLNHF